MAPGVKGDADRLVLAGAISALLAVGFGAFGAHALRPLLSPAMLEVYKTAVSYQMYHALGAILIAILSERRTLPIWFVRSGWLFIGGSILFSGSLYALAITGVKLLGAITPLGGVCFLAGWVLVVLSMAKSRPVIGS